MKFDIKGNRLVGFIRFCYSTPQKQAWIEKYPQLKGLDYENFVNLITQKGTKSKSTFSIDGLYQFIDQVNSSDDFNKILNTYQGSEKVKQKLVPLWNIYNTFYQENSSQLNKISKQANSFMNQNAIKLLKNIAQFYGCNLPPDYTIPVYISPVAISATDHYQHGGYNRSEGDFLWIGNTLLNRSPENELKWAEQTSFHEASHKLYREPTENKQSGWEQSLNYWTNDNPVVQLFKQYPQLKPHSETSEIDCAHWILNEGLATAFQGIFEQNILLQNRKNLYANPVVNTIAHKLIPILKNTFVNHEKFGPQFIKKFEKTFIESIPEMLQIFQENNNLLHTLQNSSVAGRYTIIRNSKEIQQKCKNNHSAEMCSKLHTGR